MVTRESTNAQAIIENVSWSPKVSGDYIGGKCTFCDFSYPTKYGTKLLIKIDADEVTSDGKDLDSGCYLIWGRAHIVQSALQLKLTVGDNLGISFVEEKPIKIGSPKKIFKLQVEKTEVSEKWIEPIRDVNEVVAEREIAAAGLGQDHKDKSENYTDDLSGLGA